MARRCETRTTTRNIFFIVCRFVQLVATTSLTNLFALLYVVRNHMAYFYKWNLSLNPGCQHLAGWKIVLNHVCLYRRVFELWGPVSHLTGGWIARLFLPNKKSAATNRGCVSTPWGGAAGERRGKQRGSCGFEESTMRVGGPPGRVTTMRPATVSTPPFPTTPQTHSHKDTPIRRHGCAFVLWVCPTPGGWRGTPGGPLNH